MNPEWRSVDSGLPEQDTPVLAVESGDIRVLVVRQDHWEDPYVEGGEIGRRPVTHWMPLPPLPPADLTEGRERCPGCDNEIAPEVCWCGEDRAHHTVEHGFVPMGCDCGRVTPAGSGG